jgi:hypothetical protein
MRSDQWPKWACRRAPTERGALLERWRAQCGTTTRPTIQQTARSRIGSDGAAAGYTCAPGIAFLSPAAILASSPHQSTSLEAFNARRRVTRSDTILSCHTSIVSGVPIIIDRDDIKESRR